VIAAIAICPRAYLMSESPVSETTKYDIDDLIELMSRLRDPSDGCPWDLAQSYADIVPSTIEEAYEVADCIERGNYKDLREELGDLLFQTIFYSQLAKEQQLFDLTQVISDLVAKLVRRHPHVFPDGTLNSRAADASAVSEVKQNWEALKEAERTNKGHSSAMDDIPLALPALTRSQKVQKRAANLGFDWNSPDEVLPKIDEELIELRQALQGGDKAEIEEELGDLLFSCVNLSRKLKLDSEQVLRKAQNKFETRFRKVEQLIENKGLSFSELETDQLEDYWRAVKKGESV
jgi:nucleoside triphosphate diphosphatase